ncbi:MAG: family 16 glycoside hydrolase [Pirellula sp.]
MQRYVSLAALLLTSFLSIHAVAQEKSLFNGNDLQGWDGNPELWSVENGTIIGITKADDPLPYNQFLIWRGGTVKNFELRVTIRQSGNNSGIQYRSKELPDVGKWSIGGYQCDIHPTPANNAMLYDERGRGIVASNGEHVIVDPAGKKWITNSGPPVEVNVADWNEYKIKAMGNRLVHQVNGKTTVEIVDHQDSERELEGLLAFQVHRGPAMKVEIKDIYLRELADAELVTIEKEPIPKDAKEKGSPRRAVPKAKQAIDSVTAINSNQTDTQPNNAAQIATAVSGSDQPKPTAQERQRPRPARPTQVGPAINENKATPIDRIKVAKDFTVELLYSVPGSEQGSWVNLCLDNKGRIIVSDQYGGLFRFTAPPLGQSLDPSKVQKLPVDIRAVNGMVWAYGALYVGVNDYESKIPSGLYRISDSNGDDELDKVEMLRELMARGDHGVHAVLPTPDGKALYLVCGNGTKLTQISRNSPVPSIWGEDHLLPRMPDGKGFMRDVLAPGGIIYRVSPDGKDFEVFSSGYRNIFDASLNEAGELFTYDADMEYDFNTSWYRPTRVNHVVSGSEYGWRNGAGKRPEFYVDNLPATINIGPGSPTGTTFGYGAKFPAKYQQALFVLDWSWGKLYAVHLQPKGSTYTATKEDFISGLPLPLTDAIIHPADGAMYFTIGGRRVQSGLYRVTYVGSESTAKALSKNDGATDRTLRKSLERFHGRQDPAAVDAAWPHLNHSDRFMRWAARTAIEHQPIETWIAKALSEKDPAIKIESLLAATRAAGVCPQHRSAKSGTAQGESEIALGRRILSGLESIEWMSLSPEFQLGFVRTVEIAFNRFGQLMPDEANRWIAKLDQGFPAKSFQMNWLLCETLVYLGSPTVAEKGMRLIEDAPSQEAQIEYARSLRMLKSGWTKQTRTAYLEWLLKAANYRGGASFERFIEFIRADALGTLSDSEKTELSALIETVPKRTSSLENVGTIFAGRKDNNYQFEEVAKFAASELEKNGSIIQGIKARNLENGRKMFGAAACFTCHRFDNQGGMNGPDLTSAARRYSVRDLVEQIMVPSKEINEQFVPIDVITEDDERFRGVVVNLNGDTITLNTDAADPNERKAIDRKKVISIAPSKVSPMPLDLLAKMTKDEIVDLLAYVLNGGTESQ